MRRAVCPGSFDPIHLGHIEVVARASSLFDEVVVAVSHNPSKTYRFDLQTRMTMAEQTLHGLAGISVVPMGTGLLAEFCREMGADVIVKGLRNTLDLEYERPMATMNRHLTGVETVFLPADGRYTHLSSSLIKEIHALGGDTSEMVPQAVQRQLDRTSG